MNTLYREMIDALKSKSNILITGHLDPDADCIGTMLGLYFAFQGEKKNWQLVLDGDIPDNLKFMPGVELIKKPVQIEKPEAVFLVDCSESGRAGNGWLTPYWQESTKYILDHHLNCQAEGDIIIQDANAAATGVLAYKIIEDAGIDVDQNTAINLYSAIVSDTGGFRYANVTPEVFQIAAKLLEKDINLEEIRINLFEQRSKRSMAVLGSAINSMEYYHNDEIAIMTIDNFTLDRIGAKREDCKEIINFSMMPKGVKVGLLFEENHDGVKVGLRCRVGYDVNKIAISYGGGGHALAAGCLLKDTSIAEAKNKVLNDVICMLDNNKQ